MGESAAIGSWMTPRRLRHPLEQAPGEAGGAGRADGAIRLTSFVNWYTNA